MSAPTSLALPPPPPGRQYGTVRDAAVYLRVSPTTVRRLVDEGRLRAYRPSPRRLILADAPAAAHGRGPISG